MLKKQCFIMICTNSTEEECFSRNLFGDTKKRENFLRPIKKGDIGFLYNINKDILYGVYIAKTKVKENIEKDAWGGSFPLQVKVAQISGERKDVKNASSVLPNIFRRSEKKNRIYPQKHVYGPETTREILQAMKISNEEIEKTLREESAETYGDFPEIKLKDVGGLNEIKTYFKERVIDPMREELLEASAELGIRINNGILLYGLPGTGKTLIAKAIAGEMEAKFIEIDPTIILGYPGEAEKRLKNLFDEINAEPRVVLFLDEAEWILMKRENLSSSVMQRLIPLLLMEMNKILNRKEIDKQIIIIAATNKPFEIDDAFLRPGRFDRCFYISLPDKEARVEILKINLQKRSNKLTLKQIEEIAEYLEGYSGADIKKVIENSAFLALNRYKEAKGKAEILYEDIKRSIKEIKPSVSKGDKEKIENWAKEKNLLKNF